MEPKLAHGDYIPDNMGGILHASGSGALLARVLFRLTARRGALPFLPRMGSRLYLLSREPSTSRLSAAKLYVKEALAEEPVRIDGVELTEGDRERVLLRVSLTCGDSPLSLTLSLS